MMNESLQQPPARPRTEGLQPSEFESPTLQLLLPSGRRPGKFRILAVQGADVVDCLGRLYAVTVLATPQPPYPSWAVATGQVHLRAEREERCPTTDPQLL